MKKKDIYLGEALLKTSKLNVHGEFVTLDNQRYYRISNYDRMPDFFMTIVSDSDHWMFISSNGSLSAGRKNRDNALFPYYSEDKIHDYKGLTGSETMMLVETHGKAFFWRPFSGQYSHLYDIRRNIYKNIYGNQIIFEEVNNDLEIAFRYGWCFSEQFGFIKKSWLRNLGATERKVEVLDGIKNILPQGVDYLFQNEYSNLLDAYKKAELIEEAGLGLFMLSSIPVDRAEPSESLNATTVWSRGLIKPRVLLSEEQLEKFKSGRKLTTETDIRAARGAFLVNGELDLEAGQELAWLFAAEINQGSADVANLTHFLKKSKSVITDVKADIEKGTQNLIKIVASADGLQTTGEELCTARHYSNTLFNVMRGGIFPDNYNIDLRDFKRFVGHTNKQIDNILGNFLESLPNPTTNRDLLQSAWQTNNNDLVRICHEYLPLTFSRRHGDPSRPWNLFSIENKNEDGSPKLDFQGNWRDIFQNWEALSLSYPGFIEQIIAKFLNATTADGYNPYRIMRSGIDWEAPDPDDPWAYIGYWGDHQIIYLQKLLELSDKYYPGNLEELLDKEIFAYANVPYRIKAYEEMVENPQDTIVFDHDLNHQITDRVKSIGADGRLLLDENGKVHHVNLLEKILATLLAKLCNFIPEAGIWLNTQRPEWNDANNALVGNGASMVTLYYLRRFLEFWNERFQNAAIAAVQVSDEIWQLFDEVLKLFQENTGILKNGFSDRERRYFTDSLGKSGGNYRNSIYHSSFSGKKKTISSPELARFTQLAMAYADQSIRANKREDGLYHAYNLVSFQSDNITIRHLYEMLEGQVAVLSSGLLSAEEVLEVLDALKQSRLFRSDQYSYLLYPDRQLPRFVEKNNLPQDRVKASRLLNRLAADGDTSIVNVDQEGVFHFNGTLRNASLLTAAIDALNTQKYGVLIRKEREVILDIYEEMFDHQSFTGRSGTFYGYEGLGSIYWHMVSKLLLAVEECIFHALDTNSDPSLIGKLKDHYYEIKAGIGLYKSPELYGAFPTDAYSHTPGNAGAKQPGMTGQVKEDFISRMGELGVRIRQGQITFDMRLLNTEEFAKGPLEFNFIGMDGMAGKISLKAGQLGVTICQVPVVYSRSGEEKIVVTFSDGKTKTFAGQSLDEHTSKMLFNRTGEIDLLEISIV